MLDHGQELKIIPARRQEIAAIRAMQIRSFLELGAPFYSPHELSGFIAHIGTMDDSVVDEGHFFIGRDATGRLLASGGWSRREPGYDLARIARDRDRSEVGTATVRSVFVDPACARMGYGTAIMRALENDAIANGVFAMRLMATLSGEVFYARLGWQPIGHKVISLPDGSPFSCISMQKRLVRAEAAA